jgi:hypothetical protein
MTGGVPGNVWHLFANINWWVFWSQYAGTLSTKQACSTNPFPSAVPAAERIR